MSFIDKKKKKGELHSPLNSLPAPSIQVMDGCNFPLLPPPSSILFDKQHKHLKQKRYFNHSLNRDVFMQNCAASHNKLNTSLGIKMSNKNNGKN